MHFALDVYKAYLTSVHHSYISKRYIGWLEGFESEKKFDSSYDRRSPLVFKVCMCTISTIYIQTIIRFYILFLSLGGCSSSYR